MHEHDAVHELHAILPADGEHLAQVCRVRSAGFFPEHMFAGSDCSDDPFLAHHRRQRNVNCINLGSGERCFVATMNFWRRLESRLHLTFADELFTTRHVAGRESGDDAISGIEERLPVFGGDARRAENPPTEFGNGFKLPKTTKEELRNSKTCIREFLNSSFTPCL